MKKNETLEMIAKGYAFLICACGYSAEIERFLATEFSGPLPEGVKQCPSCRRAWQSREVTPSQRDLDGRWKMAVTEIVPAQPFL